MERSTATPNEPILETCRAKARMIAWREALIVHRDAVVKHLVSRGRPAAHLVSLLTKLDLNSLCVFCKPLPHLLVRPRPLYGVGITVVVFRP